MRVLNSKPYSRIVDAKTKKVLHRVAQIAYEIGQESLKLLPQFRAHVPRMTYLP